ncbi:MAG: tRNA (adenosine(37)-N6)-threonylcarbamoyltransferase complex transferase subunit TsaD, partial [Actinobacteria bacterium]|nr:tRNA (adenosine(37)-N6)-threonylcarbamoyltransferase complex transferase subunit TsaD [Actinomycetota bacterium]
MEHVGQKGDIKEDIYILGIETSCDDTCASVVKDGRFILSNVVSSQEEIHRKYGGIVPEVASRRHIEIIDIVIKEAIENSGVSLDRISAVAVTNRPGLIGSLLVGVGAAKAICYAREIPLIAINHLKAHIFSNILANPDILANQDIRNMDDRFVALVVSGGHSSLYLMDSNWGIKTIGYTLDDAAGEAFDKIARYLNLGYPGGPIIDRLSKKGNPDSVDFPRPMMESGDFNFSFSGLKTALIYRTKKERELLREENIPDLVAS